MNITETRTGPQIPSSAVDTAGLAFVNLLPKILMTRQSLTGIGANLSPAERLNITIGWEKEGDEATYLTIQVAANSIANKGTNNETLLEMIAKSDLITIINDCRAIRPEGNLTDAYMEIEISSAKVVGLGPNDDQRNQVEHLERSVIFTYARDSFGIKASTVTDRYCFTYRGRVIERPEPLPVPIPEPLPLPVPAPEN